MRQIVLAMDSQNSTKGKKAQAYRTFVRSFSKPTHLTDEPGVSPRRNMGSGQIREEAGSLGPMEQD